MSLAWWLWGRDERPEAVIHPLISSFVEGGIADSRWQEEALAHGATLLLHSVCPRSAAAHICLQGAVWYTTGQNSFVQRMNGVKLMPRTVLDEGLRDLHLQMTQVAQEVESAFLSILTALSTGEHQGLPPLLARSLSIHRMCAVTEQQALRLLILQQPLAGPDLRFLTAALFISEHFGHLEDAMVQIAETLLRAASLHHQTAGSSSYSTEGSAIDPQGRPTEVLVLRGLLLLGQEIQYILSVTIEAFAHQDAAKARVIESEHAFVELRYAPIYQDIQEMQTHLSELSSEQRDPFLPQRLTSLLWIAHKLAEMATSLTTICQRIIFIRGG